jgi:hypothetical protein
MSHDPVFRGFLETAVEEARRANAESDVVRLLPHPLAGDPADKYLGLFRGIEYLVRAADGSIEKSNEPIPFTIEFPADYLRSVDRNLGIRVARFHGPLLHPNVSPGGFVCLGGGFRAGTRLRAVVIHLYSVATARAVALNHVFALPDVRQYFIDHAAEICALRQPPLWRRPVATRTRVRRPGPGGDETGVPAGERA